MNENKNNLDKLFIFFIYFLGAGCEGDGDGNCDGVGDGD